MCFLLLHSPERIERRIPFLFPIHLIHESKKTGCDSEYLVDFGFEFGPKKNDNMGKNIVVSVTTIKGLLFGPCSTRAERGANNISTKADGFGEPKKEPKIFGVMEIN